MQKAILLLVALAALGSACGRTPAETDAVEPAIKAENLAADSSAGRGGNLMGSGH